MKKLLYLVHRIPYPPNKGDKITSYNFLRYLSSRYRVFLGTFVDDPADKEHLSAVRNLCADACFVDLDPRVAKFFSLRGLANGEALTTAYYRSRQLQSWVDEVIADGVPDAVLIFSGAMAQYVDNRLPPETRTVFDMEDIDSEKWRHYSESKPWPLSAIYRREARRLLAFETAMSLKFHVTVFVSQDEAELFRSLAPGASDKVTYRTQGVDSDYFDPAIDFDNPYTSGTRPLVFCGAMDYWPNVDAVCWFVDEVLPTIRDHAPDVLFCIVGMNPTEKVRRLAEQQGVTVTGGVPDVRPYISHAVAAVLPLRLARGIQNKVLEAMALEKPVVVTPAALTGILPCPGFKPFVAETASGLASEIKVLLESGIDKDSGSRLCVLEHYDWESNLRRIGQLLDAGLETDGIGK